MFPDFEQKEGDFAAVKMYDDNERQYKVGGKEDGDSFTIYLKEKTISASD